MEACLAVWTNLTKFSIRPLKSVAELLGEMPQKAEASKKVMS
jgi:hypothetical protein